MKSLLSNKSTLKLTHHNNVVSELIALFPDTPNIAINISSLKRLLIAIWLNFAHYF